MNNNDNDDAAGTGFLRDEILKNEYVEQNRLGLRLAVLEKPVRVRTSPLHHR